MNAVMPSDPKQTNVKFSPAARQRIDEILKQQGLGLADGLTRLLSFVDRMGPETWPLFFGQATGDPAVRAAKQILQRVAGEMQGDYRMKMAAHKRGDMDDPRHPPDKPKR